MKTCNTCLEEKPYSEFYKRKPTLYRKECKTCWKVKTTEWAKNNRESNNKASAKYRQKNRGKRNALKMKYNADKLKATPAWSDLNYISDLYENAKEASKIFGIPFEVDHIIPLRNSLVCGLHVENNLQVLPRALNRKKSNKFKVC